MAENTKISWVTHTMNFWVGCDKVSPACDSCYAEAWAKRAGSPELWAGQRRRTKTWGDPPKWHRRAMISGDRPSVFANSLADFFDNKVPTQWRTDAWGVVASCSMLDWYLVTKRIPNIFKMLPTDWDASIYSHVVIIITVVTQAEWDRDGPRLKALKMAFPWLRVGLSIEPMLGPINLGDAGWLDWVIVGGESGGQARPMMLDWALAVMSACERDGVPFHFKQWGEFAPMTVPKAVWKDPKNFMPLIALNGDVAFVMKRVGVANSGRILQGRIYDDGPRQVAFHVTG